MRHKYYDLHMGLVKQNFAFVPRTKKKLWKERGFSRIRFYWLSFMIPKPTEIAMLGKPENIAEFDTERLKSYKVTDMSPHLGTYGMGGPGFFGLKLENSSDARWLVYCVWNAGLHLLYDGRPIEIRPDIRDTVPWIKNSDFENTCSLFSELLTGSSIVDVDLTDSSLTIELSSPDGIHHVLETLDADPALSPPPKMKDRWLVIYDGSYLAV